MAPTWFQHPDLMNLIILILLSIVAWFIRREFARFDKKLETICQNKADKTENDKEHEDIWQRVNHHAHAPDGKVAIG